MKCSHRCVTAESVKTEACGLLENIHTSAPVEMVCIDLCSAEMNDKKIVDLLFITRHFSKVDAYLYLNKHLQSGRIPDTDHRLILHRPFPILSIPPDLYLHTHIINKMMIHTLHVM